MVVELETLGMVDESEPLPVASASTPPPLI